MKFRINKEEFLEAAKKASKFSQKGAGAKDSYMSQILIEAGDEVSLTGNGYEAGIQVSLHKKVLDPGSITVKSDALVQIASVAPDGELTIEKKNNTMVVSGRNSKIRIPCGSAEEFVRRADIKPLSKIKISEFIFREMVKDVCFVSSTSEDLSSAIEIRICNERIRLTAASKSIFAVREEKIPNTKTECACIIRAEVLNKICNMLSDQVDDKIEFSISETSFKMEFRDTVINGSLLTGKFINMTKYIELEKPINFMLDKKEFSDSIDRMSFAKSMDPESPMFMDVDKCVHLHLGSNADEVLFFKNKTGEGTKIAVNPLLIKNVMKVYPDDQVLIEMSDPKSPLYITADGYHYMIAVNAC